MIKYLYVLDFCMNRILEIPISENDININDIFKDYGLKESQCSYMISKEELYLEIPEKLQK